MWCITTGSFKTNMNTNPNRTFAEAGAEKQTSLPAEFFSMLRKNKKYWMIPLLLILLGLGLLILLGGTAAAPFIYTLF
jgi:hypothetical protein